MIDVVGQLSFTGLFIVLFPKSGWKGLVDDINRQHSDPSTCLVWALNGGDPDDFFSSVPYEKGFNLLYYLESIVGTEQFEKFAGEYINRSQLMNEIFL